MTKKAHNYREDIDNSKIIEMYTNGKSSLEIAKYFSCHKSLILKRLKSLGIERRQVSPVEISKELLIELYFEEKLSIKSIAAITGCGKTSINKKLKQFEIPIRKRCGDPSFTVEERKEKWGKKEHEHPRWKGGVTKVTGLIRNRLSFLSEECFRRDGFACTKCKKPRDLHAHHIRPFSEILEEILEGNSHIDLQDEKLRLEFVDICEKDQRLLNLDNLITLCDQCHKNLHTDNPVEVVHYDILEKQWRDFVDVNHFTVSVSEMGLQMGVLPYRIISYMKKQGLPFAYENKEWLEEKIRTTKFYSDIAKEFHSRHYPCRSEDIRKSAMSFGFIESFDDQYISHYAEGRSLKEIASMFNTSSKTVADVLRKNGVEVKNKRLRDDLNKNDIFEMFEQRFSIESIRKEVGCSGSTVSKILLNAGFDTTMNGMHRNDIDIEIISDLYLTKQMTVKEIAKKFGAAAKTISSKLKEAGIEVINGTERRDVDDQEVLEMYKEGKSIKEISQLTSCSDTAIRRRLKNEGVNFPKKEIPSETIVEMYNQGFSKKKIAHQLGINEITVTSYLKTNGIQIKNKLIRDDINISEIEKLYREGKTIRQIAEIFNCADGVIGKRLGIRKEQLKDRISKEVLTELIKNENKGYQEIASMFSTSRGAVWRLAKNYEII